MSFSKDYDIGIKKEQEVLDIIRDKFNKTIRKSEDQFCVYDFYDDFNNFYELKSRNCSYRDFDTTLLPYDKLPNQVGGKGACPRENTFYLFNFCDGLFYIKYDKDLFNSFNVKKFVRESREDIVDKKKPYIFIPIVNMTKLSKSRFLGIAF